MKSTTITIVFLLLFFSLKAQDIQPVLQSGHSSKIQFYAVSYEKNLLMTADENEIMLWNTLSGLQLRRIASPYKIFGAVLCSNGTEVAVINYEYGKDASLRIYNTATGALLSTISFEQDSWGSKYYPTMDELVFDATYNRVAVRCFSDMTIVDIAKRQKLHKFKLQSYDNDFSFTAKQYVFGVLFSENNQLKIGLIDTVAGFIKTTAVANDAKPSGMISDVANDRLFLLDSKGLIHVMNDQLQQVDSVRSDSADRISTYSPPKMSISADGKKLLVPLYKNHYFYDLEKKQWQVNNFPWIYYSTGLLFADEQADEVIKVNERYSVMLDAESGGEIHSFSTKAGSIPGMIFLPSGRMMSSFRSGIVSKSSTILDLKTGMQFNETEVDYAIFKWITDSVVLCAPYEKWDADAREFIHSVEIKNVYTDKVLQVITLPIGKKSIDFATISNDQKKIAVVTSKEVFAFSGNNFEKRVTFQMPGTSLARKAYFTPDSRKVFFTSDLIRVYDFDQKKWTQLKDTASYSYGDLSFTPDGKEMWFEDYRATSKDASLAFNMKQVLAVYNLQTGTTGIRRIFDTLVGAIAIHPKEDLYAIGFFNGTLQLRKRSTDEIVYEQKDHFGHIDEIVFAPTKNWVLSRGEDGLIRFMDFNTKEHVISAASLYANEEQGYALFAPDNSYLVPSSLINELHFVKGYDTYSFAQLDIKLNRPDKVLERLGMAEQQLLDMHRKAYRRRLNKAGYASAESLPDITSMEPLRVANRKKINYNSSQPLLDLQVETAQPVSTIKALNVYVNGQKVKEVVGETSRWVVPVELSIGPNNIEVAYVSKNGMESLRERLQVKYNPPSLVTVNTYYIGVAVANYKDSSMNLKYTVKDVTDIADRYKQKDSTTKTYLFTDDKAIRSNLSYIKSILANTTVNDKVVISFSGHGLLDTAYNFYFAGWDMNFSDPSLNGISYKDINDLLSDIPARQKLVLIDACHSGEVDRDVVSFAGATSDTQFVKGYGRSSIAIKKNKLQNTAKLMEQYFTDISKDNGANIISAAAGEEYALESSEWKNGVFSYSFIKGFFEQEADWSGNGNSDKKISQSEIRKYMQRLVLKLTKGKQQPTSRSVNADYDWDL